MMPSYPPFAQNQNYNTQLNPLQEFVYRQWVSKNNVPTNLDVTAPQDYDMRGYYRDLMNGNPMARPSSINPNDSLPHYPDYYKTPLHRTFSSGSQWAGPGAPEWINDSQLVSPGGRIIFDEKNPNAGQVLGLGNPLRMLGY